MSFLKEMLSSDPQGVIQRGIGFKSFYVNMLLGAIPLQHLR